jgi:hypothetical protein
MVASSWWLLLTATFHSPASPSQASRQVMPGRQATTFDPTLRLTFISEGGEVAAVRLEQRGGRM